MLATQYKPINNSLHFFRVPGHLPHKGFIYYQFLFLSFVAYKLHEVNKPY